MLRSSSTPVIGSLLSPVSDSPNRDLETTINTKLSFSQGLHHLNLTPPSCCSSPISRFSRETNSSRLKGFRKSRSDGYLEGLAYSSCDSEAFHNSNSQHKSSNKKYKSMLRSALSFSIYNSVDEIEDEEIIGQVLERGEATVRTVSIGECIDGTGSGNFSFKKKNMGLIEEENEDNEAGLNLNGIQSLSIEEEFEQHSPSMYLATGLGKGIDGGEVVDFTTVNFDENGNVEEYYKRMVDQYPCHPLFLRNYAKLLQSKGDLHGAEDYYHSATLADPGDGEILLQYAKLVWQLHHDQDRASSYFERAAQAAPQDSNVLAAYASFLWEIEDDREDNIAQQKHVEFEKEDPHNLDKSVPEKVSESFCPSLDIAAGLKIDMASFTAADADSDGNVENYLRRMVEENPSNPLVLRNYAQFLCQSKGDLHGAEEYYSRAILADPADGEIISQYAKLVWELHHDRDKALGYFERAVQASPTDSHVLGAYASFLWETEEDEEEEEVILPFLHGLVTTASA